MPCLSLEHSLRAWNSRWELCERTPSANYQGGSRALSRFMGKSPQSGLPLRSTHHHLREWATGSGLWIFWLSALQPPFTKTEPALLSYSLLCPPGWKSLFSTENERRPLGPFYFFTFGKMDLMVKTQVLLKHLWILATPTDRLVVAESGWGGINPADSSYTKTKCLYAKSQG